MPDIPPMPWELRQRLLKAGITKFSLYWRGGYDEGSLYVDNLDVENNQLEQAIEEWAYNNTDFSGAGDHEYGHSLNYDLTKNTITWSEWYMDEVDGDCGEDEIEIEDDRSLVRRRGRLCRAPT